MKAVEHSLKSLLAYKQYDQALLDQNRYCEELLGTVRPFYQDWLSRQDSLEYLPITRVAYVH